MQLSATLPLSSSLSIMACRTTRSRSPISHACKSALTRPLQLNRLFYCLTHGPSHQMATSFASRGNCTYQTTRLDVLRSYHDHCLAGHPGITKTIKNIRRQFYWPKMVSFVTDYIHSCAVCCRSKSLHHKPFGPHSFLPIGERPWDSISMDFIEGLPLSQGHDTILVVVCCLTKMALFIPTFRDINAEDLAHIFLSQVFTKHGTPTDIVSNRGKH